jgi:hypothetical protein
MSPTRAVAAVFMGNVFFVVVVSFVNLLSYISLFPLFGAVSFSERNSTLVSTLVWSK